VGIGESGAVEEEHGRGQSGKPVGRLDLGDGWSLGYGENGEQEGEEFAEHGKRVTGSREARNRD